MTHLRPRTNTFQAVFRVRSLIAYAIRDNMAIGVEFIYSRSLLRIDSGSIKLGSDIDLGVDFYNTLQHNYSGAFIWRQYIPLGQNKSFRLVQRNEPDTGRRTVPIRSGLPDPRHL